MELISRRNFAKTAAVAAGVACVTGLGISNSAHASENTSEDDASFTGIKPHHIMCTVNDMDAAVHLWVDVMGLTLKTRIVISSKAMWENEGVDSALESASEDNMTEIVTLDNDNGVMVELTHPIVPEVIVSPAEYGDYGHTGYLEWAFLVDDIYAWYDKVVAAGYVPQTEPWQGGPDGLTFVFYDTEGNMIQLWQDLRYPNLPNPMKWNEQGPGDTRTEEQIAICKESYAASKANK